MNLFTIQAIQVVLYFIMPGVIAVIVHDSMVASEQRNWQEMSLALVTYGVINLFIFTLLSPIIQFIPVFQLSLLIVPQKVNGTALVFLDVVIPVTMAWLSVRVQRSESVHRFFRGIFMSPDPGPWDYVFSNRYKIYCLIFHLKDGRKLAGLYEKGAYASGFPNKEVYVKELCSIDPKSLVVKKLPGSSGAIISLDECFFIEFYERPAQHSPLIQRSTLWQKISSLTKMVLSIKVFSRRNHQPSSGRGGIVPLPPPPQTLSLSNTTIPSPQSLTPPEQGPQQLPSQPQQSIQDKPLAGATPPAPPLPSSNKEKEAN